MTRTVAPGKQCGDALKNLMLQIIESPTIKVVGEKRGRGEEGSVFAPVEEIPSTLL